eukprot:GHVQ01032743.1.p1 GENE.GHVQ01032743.1~~GHVQ01032743.1.p1  ORF type:complete len:542 (+),score=81.15 GHVQ01032743.1:424-2049(+)
MYIMDTDTDLNALLSCRLIDGSFLISHIKAKVRTSMTGLLNGKLGILRERTSGDGTQIPTDTDDMTVLLEPSSTDNNTTGGGRGGTESVSKGGSSGGASSRVGNRIGDVIEIGGKIRDAISQTIKYRLCQSLLVVGYRGTGKTTAIRLALDEVCSLRYAQNYDTHNNVTYNRYPLIICEDVALHRDAFSVMRSLIGKITEGIRLTGGDECMIQDPTDITVALCSLRECLRSISSSSIVCDGLTKTYCGVVIVLENFDKIVVSSDRGLGLYSLLDLMQDTTIMGLCLIFTSTVTTIVQEGFEKRIKSRFSMLTLALQPATLDRYIIPALRYTLLFDSDDVKNLYDRVILQHNKSYYTASSLGRASAEEEERKKMMEEVERLCGIYNVYISKEVFDNKQIMEEWQSELDNARDNRWFFYEGCRYVWELCETCSMQKVSDDNNQLLNRDSIDYVKLRYEACKENNNLVEVTTAKKDKIRMYKEMTQRKKIDLYKQLGYYDHLMLCCMVKLHERRETPKTLTAVIIEATRFIKMNKTGVPCIDEV